MQKLIPALPSSRWTMRRPCLASKAVRNPLASRPLPAGIAIPSAFPWFYSKSSENREREKPSAGFFHLGPGDLVQASPPRVASLSTRLFPSQAVVPYGYATPIIGSDENKKDKDLSATATFLSAAGPSRPVVPLPSRFGYKCENGGHPNC